MQVDHLAATRRPSLLRVNIGAICRTHCLSKKYSPLLNRLCLVSGLPLLLPGPSSVACHQGRGVNGPASEENEWRTSRSCILRNLVIVTQWRSCSGTLFPQDCWYFWEWGPTLRAWTV